MCNVIIIYGPHCWNHGSLEGQVKTVLWSYIIMANLFIILIIEYVSSTAN